MTAARCLIVNADDFGQSPGVNRGIIQAHEQGIVTSASLMVRWPAAAEAAAYGRRRPRLSLGLHFDLGEWAFRNEAWAPVYEVVAAGDVPALTREVRRQLDQFRRLVGRDPTHLDSHQHVHHWSGSRAVFVDLAEELGVPLRQCTGVVRYCGDFYGQTAEGRPRPEGITAAAVLKILEDLPPGFTELGCHPGDDSDLDTMYGSERRQEVEVLCDPRVRAAIGTSGITLSSFHNGDLSGSKGGFSPPAVFSPDGKR